MTNGLDKLDLTNLIEKQTIGRKPTTYYENSEGNIVGKKCSKCGLPKPLEAFNRDKSKFAGRRSECSEDSKKYAKKHYVENREQRKEYRRLYYEVNEKVEGGEWN
jgi:hypothetical protein